MNVLVKQAEEQYKNDPNVKERITEMKHQLDEAKKHSLIIQKMLKNKHVNKAFKLLKQLKRQWKVNNFYLYYIDLIGMNKHHLLFRCEF